MHVCEFKAWFEGFTEAIKGTHGTPTQKQWARIKERVAEIDGAYTPPQVFIERYWWPYRPYYSGPIYTTTSSPTIPTCNNVTNETVLLNFRTAGTAEASSLNA